MQEHKARNRLTSIAYAEIVDSWQTTTGEKGEHTTVILEIEDNEQSGYVCSAVNGEGFEISNVDFDEQTITVQK